MNKKLLISSIVALLLLGSTANAKSTTEKATIAQSTKSSIKKENQKQEKTVNETPKEIGNGFNQTLEAINALKEKNLKKAKKLLKSATENFSIALKTDPKLDIVPFAQEINVHEFLGNSAMVKKALTLANTLILNYDTQSARAVMMPLQDEMIVTTDAIPMKLYPIATENALKALEDGKQKEALDILELSLNTIVSKVVLVPLPLLVAEDLVITASALDKVKKEDALGLLNLAQDELKKAVFLGYTKKHTSVYKALDEEIEALKKEIKGKNVVEKLYDKLKESFNSLIGQSREVSSNDKSHK
jgi:hypothetical protein